MGWGTDSGFVGALPTPQGELELTATGLESESPASSRARELWQEKPRKPGEGGVHLRGSWFLRGV